MWFLRIGSSDISFFTESSRTLILKVDSNWFFGKFCLLYSRKKCPKWSKIESGKRIFIRFCRKRSEDEKHEILVCSTNLMYGKVLVLEILLKVPSTSQIPGFLTYVLPFFLLLNISGSNKIIWWFLSILYAQFSQNLNAF